MKFLSGLKTLFQTKFGPVSLLIGVVVFLAWQKYGTSHESAPYVIAVIGGSIWIYTLVQFVKEVRK